MKESNSVRITREEIVIACRDAGFTDPQWRAMTYETGAYDITEPTIALIKLAQILSGRVYEP